MKKSEDVFGVYRDAFAKQLDAINYQAINYRDALAKQLDAINYQAINYRDVFKQLDVNRDAIVKQLDAIACRDAIAKQLDQTVKYQDATQNSIANQRDGAIEPVLEKMTTVGGREISEQKPPAPPKYAELLFQLLTDPAHVEAALGDLEERFQQECELFGAERATRRYWGRVLRSFWPLLRRAVARIVKWGVIITTVRRLFVS